MHMKTAYLSRITSLICCQLEMGKVWSKCGQSAVKPHIIFTVKQHIIQLNYEGVRPLVRRGQEVREKLLTGGIHKHLKVDM